LIEFVANKSSAPHIPRELSQPYPPSTSIPQVKVCQVFTDLHIVSQDTTIGIAFGLIGTLIGMIGVFINYLTLRGMTPEIGISP
jgi:hypothetical protein